MLVVALTGGIGSGKSTVAEHFAARGVGVVDADLVSHALTAPGSPLLDDIARLFGRELIDASGALDRAALRERVFRDPAERARLEALLHPRIETAMREALTQLNTPYAMLVVPLLFESGMEHLAERVLVVDLPESEQIARVAQRSGLSRDQIERIMAAQVGRAERCARAQDLIDNSGPPEALAPRIEQLHHRYLELARLRRSH